MLYQYLVFCCVVLGHSGLCTAALVVVLCLLGWGVLWYVVIQYLESCCVVFGQRKLCTAMLCFCGLVCLTTVDHSRSSKVEKRRLIDSASEAVRAYISRALPG